MTIAMKVRKTLATARSVHASLDLFSYQTKNPEAKKIFSDGALQIEKTVQSLEQRLKIMASEEPQYRK